jgi:nucleotide-binding universal stress UspA family protein
MDILVPLDFSEVTLEVIDQASLLARSLDAKLWLIHVATPEPEFIGYETGPQTVRDRVALELRQEHRSTQQVAEKLRRSGLDVTALCPQGATVRTILQEAEKLDADLIVMGSHGRGALHRALLGSVSEGVLHKATCPVMIIPVKRKA